MSSLKEIKNRISSVKNTQQITKAMKMVSASKLRKAQAQVDSARSYTQKFRETVQLLTNESTSESDPLMLARTGGKAVIFIITADKGLCGGLNSNLCKQVDSLMEENEGGYSEYELYCFGKKGRDFFKRRGKNILGEYIDNKDSHKPMQSIGIIKDLIERYKNEEINALFIAYSSFKSVISSIPVVTKALPLDSDFSDEASVDSNSQDFIFEPQREKILSNILPKYIENLAYVSMLEHIASEHGSRMSTMDAATRNAGEMINRLQLFYNRARQAAITTELTEIISGAESIQ